MLDDNTKVINPKGLVMRLVITSKHRSGGKALNVKVTSLWDALTQAKKWAMDNYVRSPNQIKRSLVYVKGAPLAWCSPLKNKVYRVDPLTERPMIDHELLDGETYEVKALESNNAVAACSVAYKITKACKCKLLKAIMEPILGTCSTLPGIDCRMGREALERYTDVATVASVGSQINLGEFKPFAKSSNWDLRSICCDVHLNVSDIQLSGYNHALKFSSTNLLTEDMRTAFFEMMSSAQAMSSMIDAVLNSEDVLSLAKEYKDAYARYKKLDESLS
jgi:hypothetical protein